MPQKKSLTITNVGRVLLQKGYLSQEQYELLLQKGEAQAARLQKHPQVASS